ncbi:Acid phosphatase [Handroanthus impetiginosus]|uniref:Acid phosphatase n=1 Tax=Handroanthus impetiginosus TaxID=429701 RepID=A0A2G9I9K4_9LAMI|nr:Acid phosphatase [Handroanthus impetiginosus]
MSVTLVFLFFSTTAAILPHSTLGKAIPTGNNCPSWGLLVKTKNLRWRPSSTIRVASDGKDIWIFDINETALSNIPFYSKSDAKPHNWTSLGAWIKGKAPALPSVPRLYKELIGLKYKIVFLTGAPDDYVNARVSNLKNVGCSLWEILIFNQTPLKLGSPYFWNSNKNIILIFKSKKRKGLEAAGYRIIGNISDQWGDFIVDSIGNRTFKVPKTMYYVP